MKPHAAPYAYIRRSVANRNNPGDISRGFQTDEVRRLAGENADRLVVVDRDWGRSAATDKTDKRLAFLEILEKVEAGEVSALYAYAADRLARSVEWAARLLNACRRAGVPIVTSEAHFRPDDPLTDQLFYFQAMQNEAALRSMEKKAQSTTGRRRARGDKLGQAGYGKSVLRVLEDDGKTTRLVIEVDNPDEPVGPIVDAFNTAGSAYGAARILNEAKVPTRRGTEWSSKVVGDVLRRAGVMTTRRGPRGAKVTGEWFFSQLMTCGGCGQVMTGMDHRTPRYTCWRSRQTPGHPRPFGISERALMAAMQEEASQLRIPADVLETEVDNGVERERLVAKRMRWLEQYAEGLIDRAERDVRLKAIDDQIERLDVVKSVVDIPQSVDWSMPPRVVNGVLRALWERVELGPDMMPARFIWRVPEWRA